MWSNKVHRIQNAPRVYWSSRDVLVCVAGTGLHRQLRTGLVRGVQGFRNYKCLAQACQVSSLHLALFIGSVPLDYSRIPVLSAPHSNQDLVMPNKEGVQVRV